MRPAPGRTMLWQVWCAWRWAIGGALVYLLAASVTAHWLPDMLGSAQLSAAQLRSAGRHLTTPAAFILILAMAAFSKAGSSSNVPAVWPRMLILPVATRTLVAWPVVAGWVTVAALWFVFAGLILRPTGNVAPLWWPAAALAAACSLFQLLSWAPVAHPWMAIASAVPAFLLLICAVLVVVVFDIAEPFAFAAFAMLLPLLYSANVQVVAMSRRGDAIGHDFWNWIAAFPAKWRKPADHPFASAAWAQLWFECRSFGWILPLFIVVLTPLFAALIWTSPPNDVEAAWRILTMLVMLPALIGGFLGGAQGDPTYPFVALRPRSCAAHVRSKFEMAALSSLAAYLPILLLMPLFLIRPDFRDSLVDAARRAGGMRFLLILALAIVVPLVMTWRGLVIGLWVGLTGRPWVANTVPLVAVFLFGKATLVGVWVWFDPSLHGYVAAAAPWAIGGLVAAKLLLGCLVLYGLSRTELVPRTVCMLLPAAWLALVGGLYLAAWWLIPQGIVPGRMLIAAAVLAVPFSRLAGAPLALYWNHHR